MKIRNDFVSNSSSVSYIITMKKEIVELFSRHYEISNKGEKQRVIETLKEDLMENGTRIYLSEEEIYFKKFEFQTDGDITTKEYLEQEGKELDFSSISDEDIWSYIYGEYIMKGGIGDIEGFGSTQVKTY